MQLPWSAAARFSPRASAASFVVQGTVRERSGCWRLTDGLVVTVQP
jgi:hypothetical protein